MSDVLLFLAGVIADVWDVFYDNFPREYFAFTLLLFIIGLILSRIILPVIAVNETQFFGKGIIRERQLKNKKKRNDD